jgi:hypothetical protein
MFRLSLVFVCLSASLCTAQSALTAATPAHRQELLDGYHMWQVHHPETKSPTGTLTIDVPTVDLYSSSGQPLYHIEGNPVASASFLRSLPTHLSQYKTTKPDIPRPSLKEAIDMFSGLRNQESALLSSGKYTIFAVTYLDWDYAKEQNDAIVELRKHLGNSNLQVIEIGQIR